MSEHEITNEIKNNPGKSYEVLTQKIFQELNNQQYVKNIEVKRDIILVGKTAKHQIDIFWEFEHSGISYFTIVQAKNWAKNVELAQLLTFKGVLDDLPNQPRGIFVTKTGYQKGAFDYAKNNGIVIFVLREPRKDDFEDQISTLNITFRVIKTEVQIIDIKMDKLWMKNALALNYSHGEHTLNFTIQNFEMLYDENGSELGTIYDIFRLSGSGEMLNNTVTKKFDNAYVKTSNGMTDKIKISEVTCKISDYDTDEELTFDLDGMVKHILENVLDKDLKFLLI